MICRKCANIFDDSISACPDCGTPVFGDEAPTEKEKTENEAEKEADTQETSDTPQEESGSVREKNDLTSEELSVPEYKTEVPPKINAAPEKKIPRGKATGRISVESVGVDDGEAGGDKGRKSAKRVKESIGDKSAAALIVALVCILSCMTVVLTVVSIRTDVFKRDDSVKTMVLSGLSGEETGELENWISGVGYAFAGQHDEALSSATDIIPRFGIGSSDGLYARLYGPAEKITDEADPAGRFVNGEGEYSYYRIEEEKISRLFSFFSMKSDRTLNCEDAYYYDGCYYFADIEKVGIRSYITDVSLSKKIQDGSFYIKYNLLDVNSLSDDIGDRYAIVEKPALGDDGWIFRKISSEPIFDLAGVLIRQEGSFEMKEEEIELTAKDGTVYHRIVVEYPVFNGDSEGEKMANGMFTNMLANYRQSEDAVENSYQEYISGGGKAEELPFMTVVTTEVTCVNEKYVGFFEEIAEYVPLSVPTQQENGSEADSQQESFEERAVTLAQRRVEGYTVDAVTGEFIGKDAVIGKDYQSISKLLYRIYNGYDYADVIAEIENNAASDDAQQSAEIIGESDIPADESGLGMRIYDGAGALSEEGYTFCFINEKGYSERAVIPFSIKALFRSEF